MFSVPLHLRRLGAVTDMLLQFYDFLATPLDSQFELADYAGGRRC